MKTGYLFNATVVSNYDGDTLTVDLDRGFADRSRRSVRLFGCNSIELHEPGGVEARDHLAALLPAGTQVVVVSAVWDKYGGRILARITADFGDVAERMVTDGFAARWDGTGPRPVPKWPI